MKQVSLKDELVLLNGVSDADTISISNYIEDVLVSSILNSLQNGENEVELNIGIGSLIIRVFHDSIIYNFKPSELFEDKVRDAVINNNNPLISFINDKISMKLYKIYRELLK